MTAVWWLDAFVAIVALYGLGWLALGAAMRRVAVPRLGTVERIVLRLALGLYAATALGWLLGQMGWLSYGTVSVVKGICAALGVYAVLEGCTSSPWPPRLPAQGEVAPSLLCIATLAATAIVLGGLGLLALDMGVPHPDALQYHLGVPRAWMLLGSIDRIPGHMSDALYYGYDLVNVFALDPQDTAYVAPAIALNWAFALLLPAGTWMLARACGLDRGWAAVAVCSTLVGVTMQWAGSLKNDLASAGLVLLAVWGLRRWRVARVDSLVLPGILFGIAVSAKISAALLLVPYGVVALALRRTTVRQAAVIAAATVVTAGPWMLHAWQQAGTPIFPYLAGMPEYVAAGWETRSANGLTLSVTAVVENLVPLLLGDRVSGNYTIGVVNVAAMGIAAGALLWSRMGDFRDLTLGALVALGLFVILAFDGRFLTRYIFFLPPLFAIAALGCVRDLVSGAGRSALVGGAVVVVMLYESASVASLRSGLPELRVREVLAGKVARSKVEATPGYVLARQAAAEGARRVIVNDSMIYFVGYHVLNVHTLHTWEVRYDSIAAGEFARVVVALDVSHAIIRPGISGGSPQMAEWLAQCATLVTTAGPLRLYRRSDVDCDGAGARAVDALVNDGVLDPSLLRSPAELVARPDPER